VTVFDIEKVSRHEMPPPSQCAPGASVPLQIIPGGEVIG
jgi:hypothetical protein